MDAVKYLKTKQRMTKNCSIPCNQCVLSFSNNEKKVFCSTLIDSYPEEAVRLVEEWGNKYSLEVEKTLIRADYIEDTIKKFIDEFNSTNDENKKDEIGWQLEIILDFLKDLGIEVKLYENYEGDQWEFGYIHVL